MTSRKDRGENNNIERLNALNGNGANIVRSDVKPVLSGMDFLSELGDPLQDPNLSPRDALALLKQQAMHTSTDIAQIKQILTRSAKVQHDALRSSKDRIDGLVERLDTISQRSNLQGKEVKSLAHELEQLRADIETVSATSDVHSSQLELLLGAIQTNKSEIEKLSQKRLTVGNILTLSVLLIFGFLSVFGGSDAQLEQKSETNRINIERIVQHLQQQAQ